MTNAIQASDLRAGDVLLYHGTSFVSQMIRLFDGSDYSHTSIYDGSNIAEAVEQGVVSDSVAESIQNAEFVDVCRFRSTTGQGLDDPSYGAQPIIDKIAYYVAQGERYAYEEIILLAFLVATRRLPVVGWIPGLGQILRTILDNAVDVVNKIIAAGKEPMICSELVYRCYSEAGDKYRIVIVGADQLMKFSIYDSLARGITPVAGADEGDQEAQQLAAAAQEFLHLFAAARKTESRLLAVADFVTPRDIATSPNLIMIGRLKG
jgi:hypothetical protein